ncbi:response regulator [Zooshikella sp. RANM57]|uniref:response regulator n=1 Tax=Zooshikella sp. RANM57 TaxID=3425863 RepID=UPI003D6FF9F3
MQKVKLLVVDDASFIRDLIKKAVRSRFPHFILEDAVNGRRAQSLLEKNIYDLVLCDWEMPELSGLELLQWLREEFPDRKTPFIMVTSRGDREHVLQAIEAGVSDYIGKPFSNDQLISKIVKVLSKRVSADRIKGQGRPAESGDAVSSSLEALTGKAKPAGGAPSGGMATHQSSVSVLTGGSAQASSPVPSSGSKGKHKGQVIVRVHDKAMPCAIETITLKEIKVIARKADGIPQLFEQAVIDFEQGEQASDIARINGCIYLLQSLDKKMEAEGFKIGILFVDDDPQKFEYISKLIASGTGQKYY